MKAIFFTEAGRGIGLGHLTRCSAVMEAVRSKGVLCQLMVYADSKSKKTFSLAGGSIQDWIYKKDLRVRLSDVQSLAFVDSYLAGSAVLKDLQEGHSAICYMDDYMRLDYPKGIVINGSFGADQLKYKKSSKNEFLLGVSFIPLRPPFWNLPLKAVNHKVQKILITFGGTDEARMTSRVLNLMYEGYAHLEKIVVIGNGFQDKDILLKEKWAKTKFIISPNAQEMLEIMNQSDVAISSGGQTLYELARCGVPTVMVTVADNQKLQVKAWGKTGFFFDAGVFSNPNILQSIEEGLKKTFKYSLRRRFAQAGPKIVDGQGALRIANASIRNYVQANIEIRSVLPKDRKDIWVLSNHPDIRRVSFQMRSITWKEHQAWFTKIIADASSIFLVAYAGQDLLGQLRLSCEGDEVTVSMAVHPTFQNCGVGRALWAEALPVLKKRRIFKIKAWIKVGNLFSEEFFKSVGFKRRRSTEKNRIYMCNFIGN